MRAEIKERIEQIKNGQVPEGYKKTKVGVVPKEWEETKLDKYLTVNKEKNTDLKYSVKDVFSISGELGIVNQIELLGRSYAGASVATYGVVYPNDVVYTKSPLKTSPYGIIKTNKTKKFGIVSTLYAIFHCNSNANPAFIQYYFESYHNLNNYLYPIVNIGAKHDMKISNENALKGYVVFPSFAEQKKIAEILSMQDKIIELQQKKIVELKKLKKAMLQRMFPKKDENVPEIRFPGFIEPWEQRKLSDLAEKIYGGGTPATSNEAFWNGTIPWIQSSDIADGKLFGVVPRKYITNEALNKSATQLVPENSIAIIIRVGVGKLAFMPFPYTTSQDFLSLSKLNTEPFFTVYACYKKLQSELNAVQGTSIKGITKDDLLAKAIMVPKNREQEQIGYFFRSLDNLITLHQRKCDEEKQNKKALMQLLLKGIVRVLK